MTIEEILKYVMSSPENTNPAILKEMLEEFKNQKEEEEIPFA
jgi:hypothetical protein